ncbi:hypothetical protein [Fulvivirga sedimenti]|uniref:Uncharacterized protein n=1 Tax=Fulvivirga sedimenti TaxID=2879465 RepID=A0A9X1HLU3_9BACT|nr:hypothetical protein [Fulvivirga sedimenti]MCA6074256.1 hypothetical protein [Fulvivirga sedimenti]
MRNILIIFLLAPLFMNAQDRSFEPGGDHPYGMIHPDAPIQTADFAPMLGVNTCISVVRNPDGTWQDSLKMIWTFKYIMNGSAVQDEVFSENNRYAGSIRKYNSDSAKWFVTYYSSASLPPYPHWTGNKQENGDIVLHRPQPSPQGQAGDSRLTFYEIGENSFNWIGEWVSENGSVIYPFWKIFCKRE